MKLASLVVSGWLFFVVFHLATSEIHQLILRRHGDELATGFLISTVLIGSISAITIGSYFPEITRWLAHYKERR